MKALLVLSVLFTSISSMAASLGVGYGCTAEGKDRFTVIFKPGKNIVSYYRESADHSYAWKGTLKLDTEMDCAKNSSCYSGAYSASAIKPGATIPKTLIHMGLAVPREILNGAIKGPMTTVRMNTGERTFFYCHMLMK